MENPLGRSENVCVTIQRGFMSKKAFIAVDIQNIWYSAREAFGPTYRVDFKRLRDLIGSNLGEGTSIEAIAYVVVGPEHDNTKFINMLELIGFIVKKRHLRHDKVRGQFSRTDWDVGVTVDTMKRSCAEDFDVFVLVSGDGDYYLLCQAIKEAGQEVLIYTFEHSASNSLKYVSDELYLLNRDLVFNAKR